MEDSSEEVNGIDTNNPNYKVDDMLAINLSYVFFHDYKIW